jgi:hypothetical protein
MGTHWELEGNMLETKEKNEKKILPPPLPPLNVKSNDVRNFFVDIYIFCL